MGFIPKFSFRGLPSGNFLHLERLKIEKEKEDLKKFDTTKIRKRNPNRITKLIEKNLHKFGKINQLGTEIEIISTGDGGAPVVWPPESILRPKMSECCTSAVNRRSLGRRLRQCFRYLSRRRSESGLLPHR